MINTEKSVILFAFHAPHALTTLKAIVFDLQEQYEVVGITFADEITQAQTTQLVQTLNIQVIQYPSLIDKNSTSIHKRIRSTLQKKRRAAKLITDIAPVSVLFTTDNAPNEAFLAQRANQCNIPTLLIHWSLSLPQRHYDELFKRPQRPTSFYWQIRRSLSKTARSLLGFSPVMTRSLGGGPAKLFAVGGSAYVEQFAQQGVPQEKMIVTGSPPHDCLYKAIQQSDQANARKKVEAALNITLGEQPFVVFATQPMTYFGLLDETSYQAYLQSIVENVLSIPDVILVIKLHPREFEQDYAFIEEISDRLHIIKALNLSTAIDACDVFVSQFSTTILDAMAFEKPVVSINLTGIPAADYFDDIGGTHHVQHLDEIASAVYNAIHSTELHKTLQAQRKQVLANYLCLDGLATKRILDIIHKLISPSYN